MHVLVQQPGKPSQSLLFHPWQSDTPDASTSDVSATAVITSNGVIDNASLASSAYSLFMMNSSDEGICAALLLASHGVLCLIHTCIWK